MPFTVPNATDLVAGTIRSLDQAEPDSLDFQAVGNRRNGVISGADVSSVSSAAGNPTPAYINVTLTACEVVIDGVYGTITSNLTAIVPAAPAGADTRFDVICAYNSGGTFQLDVISGTISATNPIFPTIPSTKIPLYAVYVKSGENTVDPAELLIDKRVLSLSSTVRTGTTDPAGSLGSIGDLYLDTSAQAVDTRSGLWVKTGATTWRRLAAYGELTGDVTTVGTTSTISANAVTEAKIATGAVTSAKIADGTIVDGDISASAGITLSKLATGAAATVVLHNVSGVPTATALSGDITVSNTGVVTIGTNAVTTTKINDLAVTTAKINDLAVTTAKINDGAVTSAKIADLTIATGDIADLAISTAKIADSAVTSAKIADGTIVNADISATASIALTKLGTGTASISVSGNAATATKASTLAQGGGSGTGMTFNWSGQPAGNPSWLWGSNDGVNHYVWDPLYLVPQRALSSDYSIKLLNNQNTFEWGGTSWYTSQNLETAGVLRGSYVRGVPGAGPGLPEFAFTSDVDTGMYNPADGNIRFACNGVARYVINSSGGSNVSSLRYKTNVAPMSFDSSKLLNIKLVTFSPKKADGSSEPVVIAGVIAEQLHEIPECRPFVVYDEEGRPDAVAYDRLAVAYIDLLKNHEARLKALEAAK